MGRLERALAIGGGVRGLPPVERWNPPYCGDVGLAIAADGTWTYGGSPIRREGLVKLFASVLRRDEDGRHYLVTPVEKVDVRVADAPFLAVDMDVIAGGDGADTQVIVVATNIGDVVRIGPEHPLRFDVEASSGGLKPYVLVRGRLEARFTRSLAYDLALLAAQDGDGTTSIRSGGATFRLPLGDTRS
ncbi:MAG: DUF1285 domain-containing protein [Hyphomicrobiaceae bacterium]